MAASGRETQRRWIADGPRYPLEDYADSNLVVEGGRQRLLDAGEKEVLSGFLAGHTAAALSRAEK